MCMDYKLNCECGKRFASFNFKDGIFPPEVISRLYCPECSKDVRFSPDRMLYDNGWIIEYDMDVAKFIGQRFGNITPEFLFDEGYCTWRGMTPTDHIDSLMERESIVTLARTDPRRYLEEIKNWAKYRMERLQKEGWRKAKEAENARV